MFLIIILLSLTLTTTLVSLFLYHSRQNYRELSTLLQDAAECILQEADHYQSAIGKAKQLMDVIIDDLNKYFTSHTNFNQITDDAALIRVRAINDDLIAELSKMIEENQMIKTHLEQSNHENIKLSQEFRKLKGIIRDYEFADELNKVSNIEKLHEQGTLFIEIERARRQLSIELGTTKVSP